MRELNDFLTGRVLAFTAGDGDDVPQAPATLVEVTDRSNGIIELAFDMRNPKRRVYLAVKTAELRAAIKEQPNG